MQDTVYIDTPEALHSLAQRLRKRPWLAFDTEFERSRTYYPRLCLLQVADKREAACIDPLVIDDLSPITNILRDPRITKVFHAAGQDLEVLHHALDSMPAPVFDTQLAATLLGHPDQIGYARLVKAELGVDLEKAHTRTQWSKRPLSAGELEYAADDVRYLHALYQSLSRELSRRGRRDWLKDDMAALTEPERYSVQPHQAFHRMRGWRRLRPSQQQILARLAEWRERKAMARNRPRRWVLKDETLLDIARRRPTGPDALGRVQGLSDKTLKEHGSELLTAVRAGQAAPAQPLAAAERRLEAGEEPVVDALMAALRQCALEAEVAPAALGNRRELEELVTGQRDLPLLQGWRRRAAGERLVALLDGQMQVSVDDGALVFAPKHSDTSL